MKYYYQTTEVTEEILSSDEHQVIQALSQYEYDSCTNTELKLASKVKLSTSDIGLMIADLRARKLIRYHHVQSNRWAGGSGRYEVSITCRYAGEVSDVCLLGSV